MNAFEAVTFFAIMIALAAVPSSSVALVVTRSATLGVANGFAAAAGIVAGDLVFIMLAVLGLSVVAETMGGLFMLIKYLGALYLLWLGLSLLKARPATPLTTPSNHPGGSLAASFLAGFALTLGDIKAIFFYISLFPMFIDLATIRAPDIVIIVLATIASVGGVKAAYAVAAGKLARLAGGPRFANPARKVAGGVMLGAGGYILVKG